MPLSKITEESSVYDRLLKLVFSGERRPGERLIERQLAEELGVSRIPVREGIREMLAQGLLVGGDKWEGTCTRAYTPDEIRQLIEYRQVLEGGAAQLAARHANGGGLARLEHICRTAGDHLAEVTWESEGQFDHEIHDALAVASHNERLIRTMQHLLAESHYVFYVLPISTLDQKTPTEIAEHFARVWDDHRVLVDLIRKTDAANAERIARAHLQVTGSQSARHFIEKS
jgi:DNA-binding GntR family transcriptional regulator